MPAPLTPSPAPTGAPATQEAPGGGRPGRWRDVWLGLLLAALVTAAYWPALNGGLVWDDAAHVTKPDLRSWAGLARIWCEVGATQQYYPVLHTAFWIEHRLWGDAVAGYHLLNLLLHATAAMLLVAVLRRLAVPGAWLAGFLFALHPVSVESVAWISEQKNTLSTVFYLTAVLLYLRFERRRDAASYLSAAGCFALALLTKSVTATLPAALLVVAWWRRGRLEWKRDVLPLLPWFAASAAMGAFTAWVERTLIGASGPEFALGVWDRVVLAGRAAWFYAGKLVWPVELSFIYPRWTVQHAPAWQWLFPVAAMAVPAALWAWRRQYRGALAGVLLYGGTLLPVLGFLDVYPFRFSYVADHFQYLASLGALALVAAGIAGLQSRMSAPGRRAGNFAVCALVSGLAILSARQSGQYRDATTLYGATLDRNPACWLVHYNLGNALQGAGRTEEAIEHYRQALLIRPDMADAQTAWGMALRKIGRNDEAIAHFEEALRIAPDYANAHNHLGIALARAGRHQEALAHYERALRLDPGLAEAHSNLGIALHALGRAEEAVAHFRAALQLDPGSAQAHNNLGNALRRLGRLEEAKREHEEAVRLAPDSAEAHHNLGTTLLTARQMPAAIAAFERALQLQPDLAEAHLNLAVALNAVGRKSEAADHIEQVRRLKPTLLQPRR